MKNNCQIVFVGFLIIAIFIGCATGLYKPLSDLSNPEVIGTVQTMFNGMVGVSAIPQEAAYIKLLEVAQKEYQGNIDIRDVSWAFG